MSPNKTDKFQALCGCGKPTMAGHLQCFACHKDNLKKLVKAAAIIGAFLGFICGRLPNDYQKPCKMVANVLTSC